MKTKITIIENTLRCRFLKVMQICAIAASIVSAAAPFKDAPKNGGIPDADAGQFTTLNNPNASDEAKGLMRYLSAVYGKNVISGHQASYTWSTAEEELAKIKNWTGEVPGTRGFDFMDVINSWGAPHAANGLEWSKTEGGIVQLCWHWRLGGGDFYSVGYCKSKGFPDYCKKGTDWPGGNPEDNATVKADLKKLGDELQKFADSKTPVLWRPLHEPPGSWFWWHTGGADVYKRLWKMMYNYLVVDRGFNNLIWVYSASDGGTRSNDWYPGNEYVDIIGVDGYGAEWQKYWDGLWSMTGSGKKMQAVTENQSFPPWSNNTPWLWTLGWNNEVFAKVSENEYKSHYNQTQTINLDDLPTYKGAATWKDMLPHPLSSSSSFSPSSSSSSQLAGSSSATTTMIKGRPQKQFEQSGIAHHWDLLGRSQR